MMYVFKLCLHHTKSIYYSFPNIQNKRSRRSGTTYPYLLYIHVLKGGLHGKRSALQITMQCDFFFQLILNKIQTQKNVPHL